VRAKIKPFALEARDTFSVYDFITRFSLCLYSAEGASSYSEHSFIILNIKVWRRCR